MPNRRAVVFIFRLFYGLARMCYSAIRFVLGPFVRLNPRVHRFFVAVKEAIKELIRPPDAIENDDKKIRDGLEDWLVEEWREINEIEPEVFPDAGILKGITVYNPHYTSTSGEAYMELCGLYGENVSHVFLLPWLLRGGADLVALNYINAVVNYSLAREVVVITTLGEDSSWSDRLPQSVRLIEFGKRYPLIPPVEQELILSRLLLQMAPEVVHNINSDLAYRIFVKYGKALSSRSRLYVSSFCFDVTEGGWNSGYSAWYLPGCFDNLTAILVDNQAFIDKLHDIYSFEKDKMVLHYQPTNSNIKRFSEAIQNKRRLDILWASRMDRQKRPDILLDLIRRCDELPYVFHVYGTSLLDKDDYSENLKECPNVVCYGSYDRLESLPIDQFDALLFISQWEGMPTMIFEGISLGLPIIASNVGGISELIINKETGWIVSPFDSVEGYMEALGSLYRDRRQATEMAKRAAAMVRERHSWEAFVRELHQVPGYVLTESLS